VTPRWDEPYGLVAAEAMSCGTPVAAFARGALGEIVNESSGRLARGDDVLGLARAMLEARALPRAAVRAHAERTCSVTTMTDGYELLYTEMLEGRAAA
jgi:glycosyltransferase involved in cell wall biosynthesis